MPVDADVQKLLDVVNAAGGRGYEDMPVEKARALYFKAPKPAGDHLARVEDLRVPGPVGDIPVRLYCTSTEPGAGVIVYFHGGGWVLSSVDGHDGLARRIASRTGAIVVSVEYRLAPEHPYPAPTDDCWAVTAWLAEHATEWGGDPNRLAVAGDSAGANLAAAVALRAREAGIDLAHQLLLYPCVDTDFTRPSMIDNGEGYFLTRKTMQWFWDQFVPDGRFDVADAVPMRAENISGLAPATVITAEYDPLRDEGEAYAARLADAGVPTTVTRYDGLVHGFAGRWADMAGALQAHDQIGDVLSFLGTR